VLVLLVNGHDGINPGFWISAAVWAVVVGVWLGISFRREPLESQRQP
jgi:hypothetical protein